MTMLLAPINHRWQLADLCNERKLLGCMVEVGTHRGVFAEQLRRIWEGQVLYCVDPWDEQPETYLEQVKLLADCDGDRVKDYQETKRILAPYVGDKSVALLKMRSDQAATHFVEGTVGLVYLDGDHKQEGIQLDIDLWWPKVKPGGILAGHDFICPGEQDGSPDGWGVHIQPVVLAFAARYNLDVRLIVENARKTAGHPWSWYVEKPK